jgi:hypothetical protein
MVLAEAFCDLSIAQKMLKVDCNLKQLQLSMNLEGLNSGGRGFDELQWRRMGRIGVLGNGSYSALGVHC